MDQFILYKDDQLIISIPSYLKARKGIRYFSADHRRAKNPGIEAIAIEMPLDEERACDLIDVLNKTKTFDWGDVTTRTIKKGEIHDKGKGFELLTHSFNSATQVSVCRYDRVLCLLENKYYAYLIINKLGNIDGFYDLCLQIIKSAEMIV